MKSILFLAFMLMASVGACQTPIYSIPHQDNSAAMYVDYQPHEGICEVYKDSLLKGYFLYSIEWKRNLVNELVPKPYYKYFKSKDDSDFVEIPMDEIKALRLNRMIKGRKTEVLFKRFQVDKESLLLKEISKGYCLLYDNTFLVDEIENRNLLNWYHRRLSSEGFDQCSEEEKVDIVNHQDEQFRLARKVYCDRNGNGDMVQVSTLDQMDTICPVTDGYWRKTYNMLSELPREDVTFILEVLNADDPFERLSFWKDVTIYLKNGSTLKGKAYIQKLDYARTRQNPAYIHFYDGRQMKIFEGEEVDSLIYGGQKYYSILGMEDDEHVMAIKWANKKSQYFIAERVVNHTTLYKEIVSRNGFQYMFFKVLKSGRNKYIFNDTGLRKRYLASLNKAG
ncbi:MAG: hypothetical protein H6585_15165 [Flavobacteriales bacterium]|nr:hypothetical protein [Flavobacteriales bacterium]MCB9449671.1 hypothetical protein [Flavobacteriales bacterium]